MRWWWVQFSFRPTTSSSSKKSWFTSSTLLSYKSLVSCSPSVAWYSVFSIYLPNQSRNPQPTPSLLGRAFNTHKLHIFAFDIWATAADLGKSFYSCAYNSTGIVNWSEDSQVETCSGLAWVPTFSQPTNHHLFSVPGWIIIAPFMISHNTITIFKHICVVLVTAVHTHPQCPTPT